MTGGTFTVSNGGVFWLSAEHADPESAADRHPRHAQDPGTPHGSVDGEIVILPMMYLALSYDHRLIDGKTAVQFLVTMKDLIEDPARILLQL
jgi:2-oxoglutarate dehydrogenase E2 component (dihydrolipoamide succinyltransferase)